GRPGVRPHADALRSSRFLEPAHAEPRTRRVPPLARRLCGDADAAERLRRLELLAVLAVGNRGGRVRCRRSGRLQRTDRGAAGVFGQGVGVGPRPPLDLWERVGGRPGRVDPLANLRGGGSEEPLLGWAEEGRKVLTLPPVGIPVRRRTPPVAPREAWSIELYA